MGTNMEKKRRFNAVDAVLIILIVLVIAAVVVFFAFQGVKGTQISTEEPEAEIEYVVEFRQILEEFSDNFKVGTEITDSVAKYQMGEVIAVNVEKATYNGNNMNTHELVVSDWPERINVQVTIRADAKLNEKGFCYVDGGYRVSVGTAVYVRMPDFTGMGYCIDIKQTEADDE